MKSKVQRLLRSVFANIGSDVIRIPEHNLLLITSPRAGSTWLFDALRVHPAIELFPLDSLYASLGLQGRRYPVDLSNGPDASYQVYIQGKRVSVPQFRCEGAEALAGKRAIEMPYAVEKIHPEFFSFRTGAFLNGIRRLSASSVFRIVYHVREPRSSIVSFLQYKDRNPQWYESITPAEVPMHFLRTYKAIHECLTELPGSVLDYSGLREDLPGQLVDVYRKLWPTAYEEGEDASRVRILAMKAADLTGREKRSRLSPQFLGEKAGPVDGTSGCFEDLLSRKEGEVEKCLEYYQKITDLGNQSASPHS